MISSLSSSSFIPNQGRDNLTRDSFRAQLIFRIVASIKYFLSVGDLSRVEKGLVTLLRIIGYISGDFVHVLTCIQYGLIHSCFSCCFLTFK